MFKQRIMPPKQKGLYEAMVEARFEAARMTSKSIIDAVAIEDLDFEVLFPDKELEGRSDEKQASEQIVEPAVDDQYDASKERIVHFLEFLIPRKDFSAAFTPMVADFECEIRDLKSQGRIMRARWRIWQLRLGLVHIFVAYLAALIGKTARTIFSMTVS